MINILLADDHAILRVGLKTMITDYFHDSEIDEAEDGDTALKKAEIKNYDLIILDVNMPGLDSFTLISSIIELKPEAKILVFSMNSEEMYAKRLLKLGAKGYLRKDSTGTEIRKAVTEVIHGRRYVSRELMTSLAEEALDHKTANPFDQLSPREFEVLTLMLKGIPQIEIARQLNVKPSTIGTNKTRILNKLKITSIMEAQALAGVHNFNY